MWLIRSISGIGSCNSRETKYRYRSDNTGKPVPKEYWDNRDSNILGGSQFKARKKDKQWLIFEMVENDNPWDFDNTLIKMACKRSLTAATLNATAASDIFTQDIEDMSQDIVGNDKDKKLSPGGQKPSQKAKTQKSKDTSSPEKEKTFIEPMMDLEKEFPSVDQFDAFQEALRVHQAEWDDTLSAYSYQSISDREMQEKVYNSLKKYLKTIKNKKEESIKS